MESLKVIASFQLSKNDELYLLIDFLNKNLKDKDVIFGLSMNGEKMVVTIYRS